MSTQVVDPENPSGLPRSSSRLRRSAPWVAGLLVVAGAVAAIVVLAPDKNKAAETFSNQPAVTQKKEKTVSVPAAAKAVAKRFVQTAVARQHLGEAWALSGPNVRAGLTRKEWLTGNIPVVPYPLASLDYAPFKIDYSYENEVGIQIALLPKQGATIKPQTFNMILRRIGTGSHAHWVVDNWVPHSTALIPQADN
jgi:hypothetical protein